VCVCVLLTGCADTECPATLLNRQQHKLIHLATPGPSPRQRSSYTLPHSQRYYHSNHQSLSSTTLHWNPGPSETHAAKTHGSCLLETHEKKEEMLVGRHTRQAWTTSCFTNWWVSILSWDWQVSGYRCPISFHHGNHWLSLVSCILCVKNTALCSSTHTDNDARKRSCSHSHLETRVHTLGGTHKNTHLDCMFIWWRAG